MPETATTIPAWHVAGDWFDTCECNIPCPCPFGQPPSYGDCDGVLVWHVREGNCGDVRLDDLNVLMLASFVGNVWAEHSDAFAAVFPDERADGGQREAVQMIFGGQAGSWPAELVSMLAPETRGVETAPIEVEIDVGPSGSRSVHGPLGRPRQGVEPGRDGRGVVDHVRDLHVDVQGRGVLREPGDQFAEPVQVAHPFRAQSRRGRDADGVDRTRVDAEIPLADVEVLEHLDPAEAVIGQLHVQDGEVEP